MKFLLKSLFGGIIFYLLFGCVCLLFVSETARDIAQNNFIYVPLLLFIIATVLFGYFKLKRKNAKRVDDLLLLANNAGNDGINKEVGYDSKAN